jgi:hypothetical protein
MRRQADKQEAAEKQGLLSQKEEAIRKQEQQLRKKHSNQL